jgi:alkaline phosphatase
MNMKRVLFIMVCLWALAGSVAAQGVKNVIFCVPDGTSVSDLALARWYQSYLYPGRTRLNVDPLLCGMVKSHSSNAVISDSAPAMSAYMIGYLCQTKFLSMYPPADAGRDLVAVDSLRAYAPCITVMEAGRVVRNMATGLVFTCELPHATPAATHVHWFNRGDYGVIQEQMVHNSIDVVIGGGAGLLTPGQEAFLVQDGHEVLRNDLQGMRAAKGRKLWALFGETRFARTSMSNDWDRDTAREPSLAEMTRKAIELLSKNEQGFFLMVEGSKIDWSSHRNDPVGILSEMLAFDAAMKEVIDFARADGETLVVICPDHGNGGVSIGNSRSDGNYDRLTLEELVAPLAKCTKTSEFLTEYLSLLPRDSIQPVIQRYWGIADIAPDVIERVNEAREAYQGNIQNPGKKDAFNDVIARVLQSRTRIGFTTRGHTGEDVFLAIYHPRDERLTGLVTAPEVNRYLRDALGIGSLDELTGEYYCKATDLFESARFTLDSDGKSLDIRPKNNKKEVLTLEANSNLVKWKGKYLPARTKTPAIHVDKTGTWYVSREVLSLINHQK